MRAEILLYHQLDTLNGPAKEWFREDYSYVMDADGFKRQMQVIRESGQRVLGLEDLFVLKEGKTGCGEKAVILTFDDGCSGFFSLARPILLSLGFTATIFVIPHKVGLPGFLTWDELKVLSSEGFSIQSHTLSHNALTGLSCQEIRRELANSKSLIEGALGARVGFLSVPMGLYNKKILRIAREAGYEAVCTSFPGINTEKDDLFCLKRNTIRRTMRLNDFLRLIAQDTFFLAGRAAQAYFYGIARSISPEFLYKNVRSYLIKGRIDKAFRQDG